MQFFNSSLDYSVLSEESMTFPAVISLRCTELPSELNADLICLLRRSSGVRPHLFSLIDKFILILSVVQSTLLKNLISCLFLFTSKAKLADAFWMSKYWYHSVLNFLSAAYFLRLQMIRS